MDWGGVMTFVCGGFCGGGFCCFHVYKDISIAMGACFAFWAVHPRMRQVYSGRTVFFRNGGRVTPSGSKSTLLLRNTKGSKVLSA